MFYDLGIDEIIDHPFLHSHPSVKFCNSHLNLLIVRRVQIMVNYQCIGLRRLNILFSKREIINQSLIWDLFWHYEWPCQWLWLASDDCIILFCLVKCEKSIKYPPRDGFILLILWLYNFSHTFELSVDELCQNVGTLFSWTGRHLIIANHK